jgi:hypothetical protein
VPLYPKFWPGSHHIYSLSCLNSNLGSIAFGDSRTNRRRRKDSTKVDTSLVSEENRNGTTIMLTLRENIGSALNPGHRQNGDSRQSIIQHGQNGHHDGQNGYNINGLNGNSLNRNHHNGQNGYNFNNHSNGNSLDHLNGHSSGYQNGHNDHHLNFEERVPPPMRHLRSAYEYIFENHIKNTKKIAFVITMHMQFYKSQRFASLKYYTR